MNPLSAVNGGVWVGATPVTWRRIDSVTAREKEATNCTGSPIPSEATPSWFQLHPRLVDLIFIIAIFSYNVPIQFGAVPRHLWLDTGLVVSIGLCAPGLLRRQRPVTTYVVIQLVAVAQSLLGISLLVADAMLLLAIYTLASRKGWWLSGGTP